MWLIGLALAQGVDAPEEGLEIVVEEVRPTDEARAELERAIVELGYLPGMRVGDQVLHVPRNDGWPMVVVHDEGFVTAEARASFGVSPRLAMQFEQWILEDIHPALTAWRRALAAEALALRQVELVHELDQLAALPLDAQQEMVRAIWWNTADTPEGLQVRVWVEDWARPRYGDAWVDALGVRYDHSEPPPDFSSLMWSPDDGPPDAVEEAAREHALPPPGLSRDILTLELP